MSRLPRFCSAHPGHSLSSTGTRSSLFAGTYSASNPTQEWGLAHQPRVTVGQDEWAGARGTRVQIPTPGPWPTLPRDAACTPPTGNQGLARAGRPISAQGSLIVNAPAPPPASRGAARPRRPRARPRTKMATAMYLEHYLDSKRPPRFPGRRPRRALSAVPSRTPGPACGPRGTWRLRGGLGARVGRGGYEGGARTGVGGCSQGPAIAAAPILGASRGGGASAARPRPFS